LAATARDRAVPGAARYGAWQRVGGLPLGCGADVVVAACEAETPGSDRPSNRYSSGVLVPRLLAHLPHFLVVVFAVVVLYVRVSKVIVVDDRHPQEQGLKPDSEAMVRENQSRRRPSSTRTRIETPCSLSWSCGRSLVDDRHPQEQGLKLFTAFMSWVDATRRRPSSTRTRIETCTRPD